MGQSSGKYGAPSNTSGAGHVVAAVLPVNSSTVPGSWHPAMNHGMCASGGGARACAFTLGVFRALHELKFLPRLDVITSVSGGTWCSSIFMFAKSFKGQAITTEELLGAPTVPAELSMAFLQREVAPIASGIVLGDSDKLIVELLAKYAGREYDVWAHGMAAWLLRYFDDLASFDMYMAPSEEGVAKIKAQNPELEKSQFLIPRTDRPANFIMVGTMLAPVGRLAEESNVVLIQMSPDYTGSPFYPDDQQVEYQENAICPCDVGCYKCCKISRTVGGGFVETFAFGGAAPTVTAPPPAGGPVSVGRPQRPFSLPWAVGISSWAPGAVLQKSRVAADAINPRHRYWPVTSKVLPKKQKALEYQFGDGGLQDVAGILPLLQRQTKKILWIQSNEHGLNASYDWSNATAENFDPVAAGITNDVYVYFGYPKEGEYKSHCQVFDKDRVFDVAKEIKQQQDEGKAALVYQKLPVLQNSWFGIAGAWEVEILILYLLKVENFEQQLPADTQAELAKGSQGAFALYPNYKTMEQNPPDATGLTAPQVSLLAAQAEFSLKSNVAKLADFLGA